MTSNGVRTVALGTGSTLRAIYNALPAGYCNLITAVATWCGAYGADCKTDLELLRPYIDGEDVDSLTSIAVLTINGERPRPICPANMR